MVTGHNHRSVSNAREQLQFRDLLASALHVTEIRSVNWQHVAKQATPALDRGWSGESLANWCIGALGPEVRDVGAVIVATLRQCEAMDPPGPAPTPQPPNISTIQTRNPNASKNPTRWADAIRDIPRTPDTKAH